MMDHSVESATNDLWDDPSRDYRQRYTFPEQFLWDIASQPRIAWDGYMRVVLDLLPPPPARVIDVGCGPGMGVKLLLEQGYDVTGVDYHERGIAFAHLMAGGGRFEVIDVRVLEEAVELHNQFDVAVHIEVFEHIPPQHHEAVLKGIGATLRPGGMLILSVPTVNMSVNKWHYKHFNLDEITDLINGTGFITRRVVFQDRQSIMFSKVVWRLLSNRIYDFRPGRYFLRWLYLKWFNVTKNIQNAGRFIMQAEKV